VKILVVDDVAFIRRILERLVGRHGFSVQTADSGTAAMQVLRQDPSIRAVITDLHMPDMSGLELFTQANKIERLTDVGTVEPPAFILLTAEQDENQLKFATDLGFVQVMQKPPNEDQLIAQLLAIHEACEQREQHPSSTVPSPLSCPLPDEEELLADDVLTALGTIEEAIDTLISCQEGDRLRQLRDRIAPQLEHIEAGINEFEMAEAVC